MQNLKYRLDDFLISSFDGKKTWELRNETWRKREKTEYYLFANASFKRLNAWFTTSKGSLKGTSLL